MPLHYAAESTGDDEASPELMEVMSSSHPLACYAKDPQGHVALQIAIKAKASVERQLMCLPRNMPAAFALQHGAEADLILYFIEIDIFSLISPPIPPY